MHPHYNDNCIKRILLVIKSIGRSASKCLMHLSARSKEIEPARRFLIRETFKKLHQSSAFAGHRWSSLLQMLLQSQTEIPKGN